MRCECGFELKSHNSYCLACGRVNALACGLYIDLKVHLITIGRVVEMESFKIYEEEKSIVNLFEILAERIHEKRVEDVYVCGENYKLIDFGFENLRRCAISDIKIYRTNPLPFDEFVSRLKDFIVRKRELKRVEISPEDKIQGSHKTIIGGRIGREKIYRIATCEFVKKIVPGVITCSGSPSGGGVRFKVTRCDERGNVKGILVDGSTVQEIHIVTTAKNKEQGEVVLRILKGIVDEK